MHYAPSISFTPATVLTIAQRAKNTAWRLGLPHAREDHLLIWVTRGVAYAVAGGQPFQFSSHTALFVPAGTLFSFTYEQTCFGQTVSLPADAPVLAPDDPQMIRVREPKAQLELTGHIEALQHECTSGLGHADAAATAHAQLMTVSFSRYRETTRQGVPNKPTAARRLSAAFCALVAQSDDTVLCGAPMADYAAHLGVTPTHLTRVIKAECGVTASDIATQATLGRALRMLADTAAPATDIAARLGFSSPAYFTRFISSHTGQTPTQFRKLA